MCMYKDTYTREKLIYIYTIHTYILKPFESEHTNRLKHRLLIVAIQVM